MATRSCRRSPDSVRVDRLGTVDYLTGWDIQRALASARRAGSGPDVLMLLEHPSVYTAGKRTPSEDRPTDGTPVIDVDRGGLITWHGPGQLVGYPIIALPEPPDIRNYVRRLEEALIAIATGLGVDSAARVDGRSGVTPRRRSSSGAEDRSDRRASGRRSNAPRFRTHLQS
jgi:lipoyl(octanoyl) transferase